MAPQKLKPFDRVLLDAATANLSDDRGQRLIFDYYKRAGYLPAKDIQGRTFKSLQDYLSTVQRLVEKERLKNPNANPTEWLRSAEARLGLNRQIRSAKTGRDLAIVTSKQLEAPKQKLAKNRVGAVFPLEIGNNGKVVFDKRKYMSAEGGIPRPVYDFIESKHGTEVANTYQETVRKEWKDMGVAAKELEAKTGIPFERGHWLANKYGGAESARAGALQIAELNRLQGDVARGDLGRLKETGRTSLGWLDDFYEWDLTTNKLSVPGAEHLNLADLVAISMKEVDPNAMLSRRETEAKLGILNPDPVGFNFIGTQIDRDQSISQKAQIKADGRQKPSNRLIPKTVQSIDPELISQFSRQIGNRIDRRLGKSPFDATLDTTSQKYLENISKYQQFIDLDEASKAALGLYGENVKQYYADLNRQLRSGNTANLTPQQIAINEFLQENLSRAIDALPSEQRDLYRAIKDPTREGLTNLKVGDVYTDKGFGSFSADEKAALRFIKKDAPSALITVQNAAGTNIGPVMEFDESEFLQKPGAQYRLESIDEVLSPKTGGTVPNYRFTQVTNKPTVTAKGGTKGLISKLGPIGAGLAIGGALLSDNPAEAIPVAAETLTPLGDLQGAPEPAVTMVNVNGKLRPLNTDTNTLMDKPGYGLEQKGGQWREVKRGTGAASKQQSKVQAEQLIPTPKPVMANTPTGVAQLKAMPKSKNIDLINEAQYFIVNPVRSAFDRIFGKRDI